jgi:glutamine amidotransferase
VNVAEERPLVAVLDYGIGNLRSAEKALIRSGADARLTADPGLIAEAAGVVLPGVGAFGRCMEALADAGLTDIAFQAAAAAAEGGRPFAGICIGMQMLYEGSDENPGVPGLGALAGRIVRLPAGVKHPQMQWNILEPVKPSPLFDGLPDPAWVYFVHSYAPEDSDDTVGRCDYGGPVVAVAQRGNLFATQFHPEKSGANGLRLLANLVDRCRQPVAR